MKEEGRVMSKYTTVHALLNSFNCHFVVKDFKKLGCVWIF